MSFVTTQFELRSTRQENLTYSFPYFLNVLYMYFGLVLFLFLREFGYLCVTLFFK